MQRSKQGCGSVLVKEYSLLLSLSLAYTSHHECLALCLQRLERRGCAIQILGEEGWGTVHQGLPPSLGTGQSPSGEERSFSH